MQVKHTKPCAQCPWRTNSAPGWLGADTPEGFVANVQAETPMPCHSTVDYERDDWRDRAPYCAGAMIYMRNRCTLPRDPVLAKARNQYVPDPRGVFTHPQEFVDHHKSMPIRTRERA